MRGFRWCAVLVARLACEALEQSFHNVGQGDLVPNDARLKGPIDASKTGELMIASLYGVEPAR